MVAHTVTPSAASATPPVVPAKAAEDSAPPAATDVQPAVDVKPPATPLSPIASDDQAPAGERKTSSAQANTGERKTSSAQASASTLARADSKSVTVTPNSPAAMGVPLSTDPTRPARPEKKEQSFNGYHVLFSNIGYPLLFVSLCIFIGTQLTRIFSDIWISLWVGNVYKKMPDESWYVLMYLGYVALFMVCLFCRGFFFYSIFRRGVSKMHNDMFNAILKAPLSWFTATPVGRVLSTLSLDQDNLDEALPDAIMMVTIYIMILGTTLGVVIRVLPFFAIVAAILMLAFAYFFYYYIRASRVMKSSSGQSLSLVVAHVSETLQGMAVINAYEASDRFARDNLGRIHSLQIANSNLDLLQVWLQFRLDSIGCLLVLGVSLLCVGLSDSLTASSAGLAISSAFQILLFFSLMVRGAAEIDANIASAERVQQLARVEPEADKELSYDSCPDPAWPSRGEISFSNVHMSYAPNLPRVLKGVSFTILPSEKVRRLHSSKKHATCRITWHRIASHRIASHRIASHRFR
jgi:ABC-type multidrug transport system fused ATPase/permease subunit